jgi:hypothetical protein
VHNDLSFTVGQSAHCEDVLGDAKKPNGLHAAESLLTNSQQFVCPKD